MATLRRRWGRGPANYLRFLRRRKKWRSLQTRPSRAECEDPRSQMPNTAKTAIVTGASRGIGAGLVEAFLERGYNVVANSRNITKANPFAGAPNVALVDGDIGDPGTAARIVDTALSRFGRIDVLINNAGVFIPKSFTDYTTEDFKYLSLYDACRLSLRVTARRKANAAAEIGQHHQRVHYAG